MILQPFRRDDFVLQKGLEVDTNNEGFTADEMRTLAGAGTVEGEKGVRDWARSWRKGRQPPPEVQDLKSEIGHQTDIRLTDLVAAARAQGTQLDESIAARFPKYNFYMMHCGVYIFPDGGERFEALKFEVRYRSTRGVSTYAMLPGPKDQSWLKLDGTADVGLNGKLEFGLPATSVAAASAEASAKTALEAKFIVAFRYELKTQVVDAYGVGTWFCKWFMHKGDNLRNDVVFYPVVTTPKAVTAFECEFKAYFKIGHPEWTNSEFFLKRSKRVRVG